ncbi:hypothetical protein SDC9_144515 [bioreactor metagenome]|uniref:Uncharacterized protein n=1 Tax=bioreactor metagenome TaxID=1076179 RepID=A0A645E9N3_9ZZZZ
MAEDINLNIIGYISIGSIRVNTNVFLSLTMSNNSFFNTVKKLFITMTSYKT